MKTWKTKLEELSIDRNSGLISTETAREIFQKQYPGRYTLGLRYSLRDCEWKLYIRFETDQDKLLFLLRN